MMGNLARKWQHTDLVLSLITPTIWILPLPAALVHQSGLGARLERDRGRPAAGLFSSCYEKREASALPKLRALTRRVARMHKIVTNEIQLEQHVSLRMTLHRSLV
jgi:hypothetical protein